MKNKWMNLTRREKYIAIFVAVFAALTIGGASNALIGTPEQTPQAPRTTTQEQKSESTTTYDEEVETKSIPFTKKSVDDATLDKGTTKITTQGVNGTKSLTYKVTYVDGVESTRELIKEEVTKKPVTQVTSIGTYVAPVEEPASNCDSNYSGCVPIASDVDCGGGGGNGPAYLYTTVTVIGSDIYGLDRDGDGLACE